jgi:hypothetical protein
VATFVFSGSLRLNIQQQTNGFAARPGGGQQHNSDLPVVELCAIRLSVLSADSAFKATRTVLQIAGVTLMAIDNSDADPAMIRNALLRFSRS